MKTPWQYAETGNEFSHQVALFMWANMARVYGPDLANDPNTYTMAGYANSACKRDKSIPELQWLHAIKNAGHGDAIRGARSAAEGVKAGVPDIFLPVPRPMYQVLPQDTCTEFFHGMYVEMKRPKRGVVADIQTKWHVYLRDAGYCVETCYGWQAARDAILRYLGRG